MKYKWNWTLKLTSFLVLNGAIALLGNGANARRAVAEPIAQARKRPPPKGAVRLRPAAKQRPASAALGEDTLSEGVPYAKRYTICGAVSFRTRA